MLIRNAPLSPGAPFAPRPGSDADALRAELPPGAPAAGEARAEAGRPSAVSPGALPAAWFREHVDGLWRVVARLGVPAHSVDDVLQEAFIIASRRRADIGPGQERSFLVATAVRLCSNYRQRAHGLRTASISPRPTPRLAASPGPCMPWVIATATGTTSCSISSPTRTRP